MSEALGGPWLLAIDSSTEQAGVALYNGERLIEVGWDAGREQTVTLLAEIHHALGLGGLTIHDVAAIAVATGPGTFNGLRVGMSVAKGLVLGTGVPLLGVPTLAATALPYAWLDQDRAIIAVAAAGRGRLIWAEYAGGTDPPRQTAAPRNGAVADLIVRLGELAAGTIVAGELSTAQADRVRAVPGMLLAPGALRGRRPTAVAALAWRRFRSGEADDPVALEPTYLHGAVGAQPSRDGQTR